MSTKPSSQTASGPRLLAAVARRLRPGMLLLAALALTVLVYVGGMGVMTAFWAAPLGVKAARAVEMTVMSTLMALAIVTADEAVARGLPRAVSYTGIVVAAALCGSLLGWEVRELLGVEYPVPQGRAQNWDADPFLRLLHQLDTAVIGTLLGGLAAFVHVSRRTAIAARQRQHEAERARAAARRRTLESQLQALQARVEPAFLFDTLGRIRALYRHDADAAGAMLEDLIVYLRAALPHLRHSSSTVAQEATLARSWLEIVSRSAPRWRTSIEIAGAAQDARIPALVVLPLVQCAVAETPAAPPLALQLRLGAKAGAERLHIDVSTSTAAFAHGIAGRPSLEQIDERLRALFGTQAVFETRPSGDGSVARIELPLEFPEPEAPGVTR
jgi:hypothetical protein